MKLQYPPQRAKRQRYGLLKLYYTPEHTSVILRLMLYVHVQRKEIKRPISYTIMSYIFLGFGPLKGYPILDFLPFRSGFENLGGIHYPKLTGAPPPPGTYTPWRNITCPCVLF